MSKGVFCTRLCTPNLFNRFSSDVSLSSRTLHPTSCVNTRTSFPLSAVALSEAVHSIGHSMTTWVDSSAPLWPVRTPVDDEWSGHHFGRKNASASDEAFGGLGKLNTKRECRSGLRSLLCLAGLMPIQQEDWHTPRARRQLRADVWKAEDGSLLMMNINIRFVDNTTSRSTNKPSDLLTASTSQTTST